MLVVPVERHKAVARSHTLGQHGGQYGATAPGRELDGLTFGDAHRLRVGRMEFDERPAVELVELGDPAGLRHGVPLMLKPTGIEHQREIVVGQLVRIQMRPGVKHRSPRRGGKCQPWSAPVGVDEQVLAHSVVEVADRVAVMVVVGRARPLQRCLPKPRIADPAQVVSGLRVGEPSDLVENLLAGGEVEVLTETQMRGDLTDQLPVGARLPGGRDRRLQQREVALGVDHDGVGFRPQCGGQHDVGVVVRRRRLIGVLGDDEFGGLQPGDHRLPIRNGGNGIRADDPARLDVTCGELFEHRDGAGTDVGADGPGGQAPLLLDEIAVGRRHHRTLTGQSRPHVTHFATAHRIWLAGQRHRATARTADRAGGEVEVADRIGVPRAVGALVQPHGPAAHPLPRVGDHLCRGSDVGFGNTGDVGDPVG